MAWTSKASRTFVDTPLFVCSNIMEGGEQKWTTDGDQSSTDQSSADVPATWAVDYRNTKRSKPGLAGFSTWYFNSTTPNQQQTDLIYIGNHNFADAPSGCTVLVYTADQDDFGDGQGTPSDPPGNQAIIHDFGIITDDLPLVVLPSTVYNNVDRIRIRIGSGVTSFVPEIGEFFVGQAINLEYPPLQPYDEEYQESNFTENQSLSGDIVRYKNFARRQMFNYEFIAGTDSEAAKFREIYALTNGGQRACVLMPNPLTEADRAHMVLIDPTIDLPNIEGLATRQFRFPCKEIAPFRANLV